MLGSHQRRIVSLVLSFLLLFQILGLSPVQASGTGRGQAGTYDLNKLLEAIDQTSSHIVAEEVDHWEEAAGVVLSETELPASYAYEIKQTVIDEVYGVTHDVYAPKQAAVYSGLLLGLAAAQEDPQNVEGTDLIQFILDHADTQSNVNAATFALISLDSGEYTNANLEEYKADLVQFLLNEQHPNGGWDYLGYGEKDWSGNDTTPTVDDTGMAITALAPYSGDTDVQDAIDSAIEWLATEVNAGGGVTSPWNGEDSPSSVAQLIIGLTSNGIDPTNDERFVKAEGNPISNLLSLYNHTGGFGVNDAFGTRQGLQALVSFKLLLEGKGSFYTQLQERSTGSLDLYTVADIVDAVSTSLLQTKPEPNWEELSGILLAGRGLTEAHLDAIKASVIEAAESSAQASTLVGAILQVVASGHDPESFEGINLIERLAERQDLQSYVNQAAFSLIALSDTSYEVSQLETIQNKLIDYILSKQHPNGGWDYLGYGEKDWFGNDTKPTVDDTGMVITALAAYTSDQTVQTAVDHAVTWLATQVNAVGGVTSPWSGEDSPSSVAQLIIGLTANGIDPFKDSRFNKSDGNPLTNLLSLYNGNQGFGVNDDFGTRQGLQALLSYQFFLEHKGSFFEVLGSVVPAEDDDAGQSDGGKGGGDDVQQPSKKSVRVTVKGLNSTILYDETVSMTHQATPYSVLVEVVGADNVETTGSGSTLYVAGIDDLSEFDHGAKSGWNYTVNGKLLSNGADAYVLDHGDHVVWIYTANYDNGPDPDSGTIPETSKSADSGPDIESVLNNNEGLSYNNQKPIHQVSTTLHVDYQSTPMSSEEIQELKQLLTNNTVQLTVIAAVNEETIITDEVNELVLVIPAEALEFETSINIIEDTTMELVELVSPIYDFGPDGTQFNKPIQLAIKVALEDVELEQLALVWLNEETNEWIPIPASLDASTGVISGVVDHFTKFAVIDRSKLEPVQKTMDVTSHINRLVQYLIQSDELSEWEGFAVARSGAAVTSDYLSDIEALIQSQDGSFRKVTDVERLAIAVKALGGDPSNAAGINLIEQIYQHERMLNQGINGPIFALLAVEFTQSPDSVQARWSKESWIQYILDSQREDGAFSLTAEDKGASVDLTAMAITALSDYMTENDKVKEAVERAVDWLSEQQLDSGGFLELDVESSESTAQVIIALTSIGIDPRSPDFTKAGGDLIEHLLSYQNTDGGLSNLKAQGSNQIASEQGLMALAAYDRYVNDKAKLFAAAEEQPSVKKYADDTDIAGYAYTSVYKMKELGIMSGMSENRFAPMQTLTRAQLVRIILEVLNIEADSSLDSKFKDLNTQAWYYGYVAKAEKLGIVAGTSVESFSPHQQVTREQLALIVQRALQLEVQNEDNAQIQGYHDISKLSEPSRVAIYSLQSHGILIGHAGQFNPHGPVTREMAAVVGDRLVNYMSHE